MMELDNSTLASFSGSEERTRYSALFPKILLTEGALYLAEAGAYWLMDAIASHQPQALKYPMLQDLQFWTLTVTPDHKGKLICQADSGYAPAITQDIPYTDFPLPEVKLWVAPYDGEHYSIFLPSEY